jgi:hypothetical protein
MNVFQIALLIGAALTALISYRLPHALLWLFVAGADAVACDVYYAYDGARPAVFTLCVDCLVCLAIHWLAKERYEIWLFRIFQLSVFVSVLRISGVLVSSYMYVTTLELINWLALLLISSTAILGKVGASDRFFHYRFRDFLHSAYSYLRRPRKTAHWSRVSK